MSGQPPDSVELWAGPECSVVRIGNTVRDQLDLTGHAGRPKDLDVLAALGIRTVRYPVLWERTAPDDPERCDWRWSNDRLARLNRLGLRPIVGLLHHGSGPRYTSLVDPAFAKRLADYAGRVAERYPWITRYTPVNEPLTTARFSGLYGLWHPHARSDAVFVTAFLNQCRGVALAMAAIRRVNPAAELVQTEDLGRTYSTPLLRYQAEFENHRRWLTFDLLCGRVTPAHSLWDYLLWAGARETELRWFEERPCPPDILGINHYLTSERFLDQRLRRYPRQAHGGNGRHRYADVEAVRVLADRAAGPGGLLAEAWERYRRPLAATEVQLAGTCEEQLRWLIEVWRTATVLRSQDIDVIAVTLWSVFGAVDWSSLLTRVDGRHETGVWDVRGPRPRKTVLAKAASELAANRDFDHPVLDGLGWWHRPGRTIYPVARSSVPRRCNRRNHGPTSPARPRTILITGAAGTLGQAFIKACADRGLHHRGLSRSEMDIADFQSVALALDAHRPWAVINAAGYVQVDRAECEADVCWRENVLGPEILARSCAARGLALVTFSSDLVFNGRRDRAYIESDRVDPTTVFGRGKVAAEERVAKLFPGALIVRTSAFFGPSGTRKWPTQMLRTLAAGDTVLARSDRIVSPTYVPDLANRTLDLLIDGESGLWHLTNAGAVSWYDAAVAVARLAGIVGGRIEAIAPDGVRPRCTALNSERGSAMPAFEHALARFVAARSWRLEASR